MTTRELKLLQDGIREAILEKDEKKVRESIKNVILYMTSGTDVSSLFSDMVKAVNSRDIVLKKLVYLYLCTYAQSHPNLTLLAVNTLQKDCSDDNPIVRGLALRSMSYLRTPTIIEYLLPLIKKGLVDSAPYVRQVAVVSVAKLNRLAPDLVQENSFSNKLYEMIKDSDGQVVINCIFVLNEILSSEGGMAVNRNIFIYLLNRMIEFNDWEQCTVMNLIIKYIPTESEVIDVLNLLDDRLNNTNSALVLTTSKLFLKYTQNIQRLFKQVLRRIRDPIITLAVTGTYEVAFNCIRNLTVLNYKDPNLFVDQYKHFYCNFDEPNYLKLAKIRFLFEIVTKVNFQDIVNELSTYVKIYDLEIATTAIDALGKILHKIPYSIELCVEKFFNFFDIGNELVKEESIVVVSELLRRYPNYSTDFIPEIKKIYDKVKKVKAKISVVYLIAQYCMEIEDSPYLIEHFVEQYEQQEIELKLELLTSTIKVFLKRAAECYPIVTKLLNKALQDDNANIVDRAKFYYRLLKEDTNEARKIMEVDTIGSFEYKDSQELEMKDKEFEDFDTFNVLLDKQLFDSTIL